MADASANTCAVQYSWHEKVCLLTQPSSPTPPPLPCPTRADQSFACRRPCRPPTLSSEVITSRRVGKDAMHSSPRGACRPGPDGV